MNDSRMVHDKHPPPALEDEMELSGNDCQMVMKENRDVSILE